MTTVTKSRPASTPPAPERINPGPAPDRINRGPAQPAKATGKPVKEKPATPPAKANGKLRPTGAPRETILQADGAVEVYEGGKLIKRLPPKPPAAKMPASKAKAPPTTKTPPKPPTVKAAPTPQRPRLSETAEVDWKIEEKWPWEPGQPMPKDRKGNILSFELVQHYGETFYEFQPQSKTKFKVLKREGYKLVDAKLFDHEQARQAWRALRRKKYLIVGDECGIDVV
jgi:hypothetical protein